MFHDTLELRWFAPGAVPAPVQNWFDALPGAVEEHRNRLDCYLEAETTPSLAVKLHDGALEIRQRLGRAGTTIVAAHCAGRPETWRSWRFPLARPPASTAGDAGWIDLSEDRSRRQFLLSEGAPKPAADSDPQPTCFVEFTRIELAGEPWWTLAFEAPATAGPAESLLLPVAHGLLTQDAAPELSAQTCCGYPQWLARLRR